MIWPEEAKRQQQKNLHPFLLYVCGTLGPFFLMAEIICVSHATNLCLTKAQKESFSKLPVRHPDPPYIIPDAQPPRISTLFTHERDCCWFLRDSIRSGGVP
ncbi:hypothetical protein NPIL_53351 [Nephila pilipes]|uniref:Uncharacterized protein n=1 Tax=Nephila pilipes TaxID=299642 RepID=A0A8X6NMK9_NEPPI|nr:hypothetical protein NPIL_53351 [Nephila pilipes]